MKVALSGSIIALLLTASAAGAQAQEATPPGPIQVAQPRLAVVIRHAGGASAESAQELQEVMIAALSGRKEVRLLGGEELLELAELKDSDALNRCLGEPACAEPLRSRLQIRFLVLGKIDKTRTHYEFVIERFASSPDPWTRVLKVPVEQGLDGLLDPIYSTASSMPLDDAVALQPEPPPVEPEVEPEPAQPEPAQPARPAARRGLSGWGYGAIGAGGVSLVSLGLGLYQHRQANNAQNTFDAEVQDDPNISPERARQLQGDHDDSAQLANIFYGAAIGTGVLAAGLLTVELLSDDSAEPSPRQSLRVSPWLGDGQVGAGLSGSW